MRIEKFDRFREVELIKNHFKTMKKFVWSSLALVVLIWNTSTYAQVDAGADQKGMMWQTLEWSLNNPSHTGNPFDLVAKVSFHHESGEETRVTEMFYDGDDTWKFRFTGTRIGKWTFTTSSTDRDLSELRGTIIIEANPNKNAHGFLTTQGNKFALQTGNKAQLTGYRFNVYNNHTLYPFPTYALKDVYADADKMRKYFADARQYGFDTIFISVTNSWFKLGVPKYTDHQSENPDPQTFQILENIIKIARNHDCRIHIWAWGDEGRKQTPPGGKNSIKDKRVQRYIAARLGPLPGWTMGYGFDLGEWANEQDVGQWSQYMHKHMGWRHLLSARGRSHPDLDIKSYSRDNVRSYNEIIRDLNSDPKRPHFYEERHLYMRRPNLDMDGTRRFLWWNTLAGGMGGWWGFFPPRQGPHPYPNPEQLRCAAEFWKNRFLLDMSPANNLLLDSKNKGYVLKDSTGQHLIFYKEDTDSVRMNLSAMSEPEPAVAVDTKKEYHEIDLGIIEPGQSGWDAPYVSDWALAIGRYEMVTSYEK